MMDDLQQAGALLAAERRAALLAILHTEGSLRIADLTNRLGVTAMTLRRDLAQLEAKGLATRVHGGAIRSSGSMTDTPRAALAASAARGNEEGELPKIGILVPGVEFYWPEVIDGLQARARADGFQVVLRVSSYQAADERVTLDRLAETDGLVGLILATAADPRRDPRLTEWLEDCELPTVLMEREAFGSPASRVWETAVSDHALGARMAVEHLAELGHRRVGLALSKESPTARKVVAGWQAATKELGLSREEHFERLVPNVQHPDFHEQADDIVTTAVERGVTGLLVHSDPEAFAVVQYAQERGLAVPGDLSVMSYDDVAAYKYTPALTAVRPAREAVGFAALGILTRRIADPDRPVHRIIVSPVLNIRESTGPAPK